MRPYLLAGLLLITGCAGYGAARRGEAAYQRGAYRDAVTAYAEALREDPEKAAYREGLRRAQVALAQQRLREGEAALGRGDVEGAHAALAEAAQLDPGRADITARLAEAAAALSAHLERQGRGFAQAGQHERAVTTLHRAADLAAGERQAALRQAATDILEKLAERLLEAGRGAGQRQLPGLQWAYQQTAALVAGRPLPLVDLDAAVAYAVRVGVDGDRRVAPVLDARLRERIAAFRLVRLSRGDAHLALELQVDAPRFFTTEPQVQHKSQRYVHHHNTVPNPRYGQLEAGLLRSAEQRGQIEAALQGLAAQARGADEELREAERRLARAEEEHERNSRERIRELSELRERAWQRLQRIDQELAEVSRDLQELRGRPVRNEDERQRAQAEERRLERQRARLQQEREEAQRAMEGAEREAGRVRRGEVGGSWPARARERAERAKAQRSAVGEQVERVERDLDRCRREGSAVEDELRRVPPTVQEPVYQDLLYDEVHYERVGTLRASLGGERLESQVRVADYSRDAYHADGEPGVDLPAHEVRFPEDAELTDRLAVAIAKQVTVQLGPRLSTHGDRFAQALAGLSGEARLNQQVLVVRAQERGVLSRVEDGRAARAALREALGLVLPEGRPASLELSRLDGR